MATHVTAPYMDGSGVDCLNGAVSGEIALRNGGRLLPNPVVDHNAGCQLDGSLHATKRRGTGNVVRDDENVVGFETYIRRLALDHLRYVGANLRAVFPVTDNSHDTGILWRCSH